MKTLKTEIKDAKLSSLNSRHDHVLSNDNPSQNKKSATYFKKGKSGNPSGRPKQDQFQRAAKGTLRKKLKDILEKESETLAEVREMLMKLDFSYHNFDVSKILVEFKCNPFHTLAQLCYARSDKVRCEAASQLARYVAPQLKSISHKLQSDSPVKFFLNFAPSDSKKTDEKDQIDKANVKENKNEC